MKALILAAALLAAVPGAAVAPDSEAQALEQLNAADARLAALLFRLTTANVALCRDLAPALGARFHTLAQYAPAARPAARVRYGFAAPQGVELVVPGSPAEGVVQPGDSLTALNGMAEPAEPPADQAPAAAGPRDALRARIAALPPTAPVALAMIRGGSPVNVQLAPRPACRAEIDITFDADSYSLAHGMIGITDKDLRRFGVDDLAVIVAHELAHVILRTIPRLDAAGVKTGLLIGELGRNARLRKQGELEADRLAVALLYNAGYPADRAAAFFAGPARAMDYGLLRDRGTPSLKERVAATREEAALIPPGTPRPYLPAMLAVRDQPMR
ncbi:peptidase M48 family protein [Sphingomonas sp.]|uniref:peptidase M48 family protein n=1 Tax=Sphingomonas sp. TaxID=28214 RepID=UPI001D7FC2F6|nr:peptidase M48 family protein [Sphingomonas sp.]MBX9797361.1 peptidase M48 family protein [Sphingomonas sp.]